jgi:hypothetical protein
MMHLDVVVGKHLATYTPLNCAPKVYLDRLTDLWKYPNTLLDEVEGGGDMALL